MWTTEQLRPALDAADPGEATDQHARIVRAALAGVVADAKARPDDDRGSAASETTHSPSTVHAMAAASLASVKITNAHDRQHRLTEWRDQLLRLAQSGPPSDPGRVPEFLAGVLLTHHDRTGLPVPVLASRLRVAPEHAEALAVATGTAAMITNAPAGKAVSE